MTTCSITATASMCRCSHRVSFGGAGASQFRSRIAVVQIVTHYACSTFKGSKFKVRLERDLQDCIGSVEKRVPKRQRCLGAKKNGSTFKPFKPFNPPDRVRGPFKPLPSATRSAISLIMRLCGTGTFPKSTPIRDTITQPVSIRSNGVAQRHGR